MFRRQKKYGSMLLLMLATQACKSRSDRQTGGGPAPISVTTDAGQVPGLNVTSPAGSGGLLVPGSGFSGATPQPAVQGIGTGSDAKAIARWDVVPYQTFSGSMNVGVVAFHIKEIANVSFSVNGGAWTDVTSPSLNPETNVVEYWVTLRASDFSDGQVEVRAIVTPVVGIPRVLQGLIPWVPNSNTTSTNGEHSMWLFADGADTLPKAEFYVSPSKGNDANAGTAAAPVATLQKALTLASTNEGSTVYLTEAGQYNPDRINSTQVANNRWVNVMPVSGLTREQVVIVGSSPTVRVFPRIRRIHWQNLTFRPDTYAYFNEFGYNSEWFDNCLFKPGSFVANPDGYFTRSNTYFTGSTVDGFAYGFCYSLLVRDSIVKDSLDSFQRSQLVINSKVVRQRATAAQTAEHHPDFYQTWGDMKNVILYGVNGDDMDSTQVLFVNQPLVTGPDMTDAAFVDMNVKTYDINGGPPFSQFQGPINNVLLRNVIVPNQTFSFRTDVTGVDRFTGKNIVFDQCQFYNTISQLNVPPGVTVKPKNPRSLKIIKSNSFAAMTYHPGYAATGTINLVDIQDPMAISSPTTYTGTIDWGDGYVTNISPVADGTTIHVVGSLTYKTPGIKHPKVTLMDANGSYVTTRSLDAPTVVVDTFLYNDSGTVTNGLVVTRPYPVQSTTTPNLWTQNVTIKNGGTTALSGIVKYSIASIGAGVTIKNGTGVAGVVGNERPYHVVSPNGLAPDQTVTLTVEFDVANGTNGFSAIRSQSVLVTTMPDNDVSSKVSVTRSAPVKSRTTGLWNQTVTIKNTSTKSLNGTVDFILKGLTAGVSLSNATGMVMNQSNPYVRLSTAGLAAGASITSTLSFSLPSTVTAFNYQYSTIEN